MQEKSVPFFTARCMSYCFYGEIFICGDCAVATPFKMPSNSKVSGIPVRFAVAADQRVLQTFKAAFVDKSFSGDFKMSLVGDGHGHIAEGGNIVCDNLTCITVSSGRCLCQFSSLIDQLNGKSVQL